MKKGNDNWAVGRENFDFSLPPLSAQLAEGGGRGEDKWVNGRSKLGRCSAHHGPRWGGGLRR
jgi:hypothetical protein